MDRRTVILAYLALLTAGALADWFLHVTVTTVSGGL